VFARAIRANLTPAKSGDPTGLGRDKTLGERQAEALGRDLRTRPRRGLPPAEGGRTPAHLRDHEHRDHARQARGAELEFGGMTTAGELRRMLCDAKITRSFSTGRANRWMWAARSGVSPGAAQSIGARDGGCAHPGCDRSRCGAKCIILFIGLDGGRTDIDNLVMLCREHHRVNPRFGLDSPNTRRTPRIHPQNGSISAKRHAATPDHSYRRANVALRG